MSMANYGTAAPFSGRFWDKSPEGKGKRVLFIRMMCGGTMAVIIAMFAYFSIWWGALWKSPTSSLNGWLVDFDGGEIGQVVTQNFANSNTGKVSWSIQPASNFPNGASDIVNAVREHKCWAAIMVNSGATSALTNATQSPSSSYNGSLAVTAYGVEARNENAYRNIVKPSASLATLRQFSLAYLTSFIRQIDAGMQQLSQRFAVQYAQRLATSSTASNIQTLLSTAPQVLTAPILYTIDNVIPFDHPVANAATFVGMIFILILAFFIANIGNGALEASGFARSLPLRSLVALRLIAVTISYFFISLFYTALNAAFDLPFDRKFGHGGFMAFWMLTWAAFMALGFALEAMMTLMTPRFVPFFLLLWIMVNFSVCFLPLEVLPSVFKYGYATPFYNTSKGVRTIVFGTKNQLGLNFGVLFVWIAISLVTLPLFQGLQRKRLMKAQSPPHNEKIMEPPSPE